MENEWLSSYSRTPKRTSLCKKSFLLIEKDVEMEFMRELAIFRRTGFLCDIIIKAAGTNTQNIIEIPAHKVILCSYSPYFRAMFSSSMIEASSNEVILRDIDGTSLDLLIDYMYEHFLEIDNLNVQNLFSTANLLQMTKVKEGCARFMKSLLEPENCLGVMIFASSHSCSELYEDALSFTIENFSEVAEKEEFLELSFDCLQQIFEENTMISAEEEKVYNALIRWIKHDLNQRRLCIPQLLPYVRLPSISKDFLCDVVFNEPLITQNEEGKSLLLEACKCIFKNDLSEEKTHWQPRYRASNDQPIIFIVGGQSPKVVAEASLYNPNNGEWCAVHSLPEPRSRCGVALIDQFLYVIGGFNGAERLDSVVVYHIERDLWLPMPKMNSKRETVGVGTLGNAAYALGGFNGYSGLSSLEFYDPRQGCWEQLRPMQEHRSSLAVACANNEIYAIGGYNGITGNHLNTVEIYDLRADRWRHGSSLNNIRSGAGATVLNNKIVVIGGHHGPLISDTVEVWDDNEWKFETSLNVPRRNAAVTTFSDTLLAIGGDNGENSLDSIEYMNCDLWKISKDILPSPRSYAGIAVL